MAKRPFSPNVCSPSCRPCFPVGSARQNPNFGILRIAETDGLSDYNALEFSWEGFYGNLGRNTLIGPGLILLAPALSKQFPITEKIRPQFRAEFFNRLNHPNFAAPSSRVVYNNSGRVGSAGLITATTTSARQIQLGLKLSF